MIDYYDNFLEEHVAQLIDMQMREVSWKYDYDSKPNGTQKHWHIFCGHNINVIPDEYEFIIPIWEKIKNVINVELERVYLNAHTFGIEPHIHRDDGDITMIYYPRLDWKIDWGGGTAIYNNNVTEIEKHFVNKVIKIPKKLLNTVNQDIFKSLSALFEKKISNHDEIFVLTN